MNKAELAAAIADRVDGLSKNKAEQVLNATIAVIIETVAGGDKVALMGFGTFETTERKPRNARNPRTGEDMQIPAMTVPKFSVGKPFKEAIKNGST